MTTPDAPASTLADPAETSTEAPESAVDAPDQDPAGDDTSESRETERYRRRLQESRTETADVQAKHDALATRVETMQRQEVERIVAAVGVTAPSAIWAGGVNLADLLDDQGDVDTALVQAATKAAVASLGLAVKLRIKPDRSQGARDGGGQGEHPWARVLGPTIGH